MFEGITPVDTYAAGTAGSFTIRVLANTGIQISTYAANSFEIFNTGPKRIAALHVDASTAILSDAVFDPLGLAGDNVARPVTFGTTANTGVIAPANPTAPFSGLGGTAGYERLQLAFDPGVSSGFQAGEVLRFGVDMDPNSIRGVDLATAFGGGHALNRWDFGGVSGAELIGTTVTALFTDGTTAVTRLVSDGSQGGSAGRAVQGTASPVVTLSANGTGPGGIGQYDGSGDSVVLQGPAGATARVTMILGFTQPFDFTDPAGQGFDISARLAADRFGANNALEVQTVNVVLTGSPQQIGGRFDFSPPGGALAFPGDDQLPVAFTAVVVDSSGLPRGLSTEPLYLRKPQAQRIEGTGSADTLDGTSGNDRVLGLAGDDTILAGSGNDTVFGGAGSDILRGGAGNDVLDGGTGTDTASYWDAVSAVVVALDVAAPQATQGAGLDRLTGIENLRGSNLAGDTLTGNGSVNRIEGYGGNDTIRGQGGNDVLAGGSGADRFGYAGIGEAANAGGLETILDFRPGEGDLIDLERIDTGSAAGDQDFEWIGSAAFQANGSAQLRFSGGVVQGDANGNGVAEFAIRLSGVTALTQAAFDL